MWGSGKITSFGGIEWRRGDEDLLMPSGLRFQLVVSLQSLTNSVVACPLGAREPPL